MSAFADCGQALPIAKAPQLAGARDMESQFEGSSADDRVTGRALYVQILKRFFL